MTETKFYKIFSTDNNILDCYVGSTNNFSKRKTTHKSRCNNANGDFYNYPLYKCIRDNGGWDSWKIEIIETSIFENQNDALIRERFYIEQLTANLNQYLPSRTRQERRHDPNSNESKYNKQYRQLYHQSITNIKREIKETCDCGGTYAKCRRSEHIKRKQHIAYLNSITNIKTETTN